MSAVRKRWGRLTLCFFMISLLTFEGVEAGEKIWDLEEGLGELADRLVSSLPPKMPQTTVAVADFVDLQWRISALGRTIAEEMKSRLFGMGRKLKGVERSHLDRLIHELCFNQTDLFDRALTKRFGRIIGADVILVGTLIDQHDSVRIIARLVKTESGELLGNASVSIRRDARVKRLLGELQEPSLQRPKECGPKAEAKPEETERREPLLRAALFETDLLRVTVKSLTRHPGRLVLELWYENLSDSVISLEADRWGRAYAADQRGTYLLGESGERWLFKDDSQVGSRYGGVELIPGLRLLNEITFVPERSGEAKRFGYVAKYRLGQRTGQSGSARYEPVEVVIKDLTPDFHPQE